MRAPPGPSVPPAELAGTPPGPDATPAGDGHPRPLHAGTAPPLYPALLPYSYTEASIFRGRDDATADVLWHLDQPRLILCLRAPSGSGKTSLLRAAVGPALRARKRGFAMVDDAGSPLLGATLLEALGEQVGDDPIPPATWAERLSAHAALSEPPVLVLDQLEDLFRRESREELDRVGQLLAATAARRRPGVPGPCHWVLVYRAEAHGSVMQLLRGARLASAPSGAVAGVSYRLDRPEHCAHYELPVFGAGAGSETDIEQAFFEAIRAPFERRSDVAQWRFDEGEASALAAAFAAARQQDRGSPLTPELQVVLDHLLATTEPGPDGIRRVTVGENAGELIRHALSKHLESKLDIAFRDIGTDEKAQAARRHALLLLGWLAAQRRRGVIGLPDDVILGHFGAGTGALLERLERPWIRILHARHRGAEPCRALVHDRLADTVLEALCDPAARKRYGMDERLVRVNAFVERRVADRQSDRGAPDLLSEEQRSLVLDHRERLPWGPFRQQWWDQCERARRARRRSGWLVGVAVLVVLAGAAATLFVGLRLLFHDRYAGPLDRVSSHAAARRAYVEWAAIPGQGRIAKRAFAAHMVQKSLIATAAGRAEEALLWRLRALDLREDVEDRREVAYLLSGGLAETEALVHDEEVQGVRIAPDGRSALAWTSRGVVDWDLDASPPARRSASEGPAGAVVFDATGARWAVFGSGSGKLRLGQRSPQAPSGAVWTTLDVTAREAAFDGSGRFLVAGTASELQVWALPDLAGGESAGSPSLRSRLPFPHAAMDVRGEAILVRAGKSIRAYRLPDWESLPEQPLGDRVTAAALSPEGEVLVALADNGVSMWSTGDGRPVHPPIPVDPWVKGLVAGSKGRILVLQGTNRSAVVDTGSGEVQRSFATPYVGLVAGGQRVWECDQRLHSLRLFRMPGWGEPHERRLHGNCWGLPREIDRWIFQSGKVVCDASSGRCVTPPLSPQGDWIMHAVGPPLVAALRPRVRAERVVLWRPAGVEPSPAAGVEPASPGAPAIQCASFPRPGEVEVTCIDLATGKPVVEPWILEAKGRGSLRHAARGKLLVVGDGTWLAVVDLASGRPVCPDIPASEEPILGVAVATRAPRFALARQRSVEVWDAAECRRVFREPRGGYSVFLDAAGDRLLLTGAEWAIHDVNAGARAWTRRTTLGGIRSDWPVFAAGGHAFLPTGRKGERLEMVDTSSGATQCTWDETAWLAVSPDGRTALLQSGTKLRAWRIENGQCAPLGALLEGVDFDLTSMEILDSGKAMVASQGGVLFLRADADGLRMTAARMLPEHDVPVELIPSGDSVLVLPKDAPEPGWREIRAGVPERAPVAGGARGLLATWETRVGLKLNELGNAVPNPPRPAGSPR